MPRLKTCSLHLALIAASSFIVVLLSSLINSLWADDGPIIEPSAVAEQVKQIDDHINAITRTEGSLRDEILETRQQATDLDRNWQSLLGKLDQVQTQQRELEIKLKTQQEASTKAAAKQKESMVAVEAARKQLEEAQSRLDEAEKLAMVATVEAGTAAKPLTEMKSQLAVLEPKVEPLKLAAANAKEANEAMHLSIASMESRIADFARQRSEQQQQIESLMRAAGQWISFADQVAPIFHQRCIACHNARNAQGRYNMVNFNAILSVGESGEAIEPGNAKNSRLVQLIEDGSMPHDADSLAADQITLIRHWIDRGARIDSAADPNAPLIRLMPRVAQPAPPQHYRAAIPVTAVAIDSSGKLLVSSGYHEVLLWSLPSMALTRRIPNIAERIYGLAFHPDGRRLAVASRGTPGQLGEVKMFDSQTGELSADLLVSEDVMFGVAFSPDGSHLAACGADGTIAIFTLDDPNARPRLIEDHSDWVNSISWSPDGRLLVSSSRDKTAKIFDAQTGKLSNTFDDHNQNVTAAVFLADGNRVVTAGDDRNIRIWNVADATQVRDISVLANDMRGLKVLANDLVLSAGSENKIRLHNANDGKLVKDLVVASDWISSLAITADDQTVLFGDQAGQIHLLELNGDGTEEKSWPAVPK